MTDHINRSLLAFAAAYLFLLPTNGVTFLVSVTFVGGALLALASYAIAWRDPATRRF
jgi:ABC-type Fe3+-siderophore transport system permease subunit